MTRTEHLLTILMEESAEVAQRASKALRFGLAEIQPGQDKTNAQRLIDEVNDFVAVYQLVSDSPLFTGGPEEGMAAIRAKQAKVEKFLAHSEQCGTLTPETP